ncbi:CDP-diacylglycerol--serine O-phosphatidyltransferase [Peribacillus sp. SCS-37]|uniref:CDP-diacylglycerol--serine O-phosphatidyltransferase n=1 Tax=Paraperibacillus esterisolvens TaxID=3115296 RepID=UPI0039067A71
MFNKITRAVPNLFTMGNLLCGVLSITSTMSRLIEAASVLIFISAFFDLLDGRVARRLKVNSEFGVQLDSLADIVSFGVAPALIFHSIASPSILTSLAFILFPILGAFRLARFNVKPTIGYFSGLPIPAAGLPLAGMGFFLYSNPWITLILAFLMVSPIRVKKL